MRVGGGATVCVPPERCCVGMDVGMWGCGDVGCGKGGLLVS